MAASSTDIEGFLNGPLVAWLSTCVRNPDRLQVYESFFDGWPFSEVLLQIDPEPTQPLPTVSSQNESSVVVARTKVFLSIFKSIKQLYEEELQQVVIASPDCVIIGKEPNSLVAIEQLKLLLLLLLGCAVQGPTKEKFIARIKELPLDLQHDIVECIKQVTESQTLVLTYDWTEQSPEHLYTHVRTLVRERDVMLNKWVAELNQEPPSSSSQDKSKVNICNESVDNHHMAVELTDMKGKFRKQRQELEEKSELLTECKEEVERLNNLLAKLRTENSDLLAEVRKAKVYRDEADAMREKAEKADRLEIETQRYKERLADAEFYRVRVEELREDNRVLLDTREMLETQLTRARQRADRILELEAEIITCKQSINEIALERDAAREKIQELMDENLQLQQVTKLALQEATTATITDSEPDEETNSGDNSLSEQLTNNAQARALKLELENRRLLSTIESLKEGNFHETSNKLLETEKEKKRLSIKCDQLQNNVQRLTKQNEELESLFKNALQENKKLQETLDAGKTISDRQIQELQSERQKVEDLEKSMDGLAKEKQRINSLYDSVKKRADDAEKMLSQVIDEIQILHVEVERGKEREKCEKEHKERITFLEKENCTMQKLRDLLELINKQKIQMQKSETLLLDQTTLCTLHQQLNSEYEQLKLEMDQYKKTNCTLKEINAGYEKKLFELSAEKDTLKNESKSLINLRAEHSKLKDDFKNLFTASERLKTEYRMLQEEYKKLRSESGKLRLGHTEMQGELSSRSDLLDGLQLENAKLQQRCDLLFEMNTSLDADRRALMDHVSQLLSQYHSLLTHSLEDKEQFHMEEKQFTDKLNNLCRQKEKLEEKIMEHYKKLDNASAKKKGFGATLVRRVRKAGSDIMNKVPSRNRRSWHEDNRLTQSQFTLAGGSGGESGGNDSDNSTEEAGGQKAATTVGGHQQQPSFKRSTGSLHGHKPRDEIALRRSQREFSSHRNSLTNEEVYITPHHLPSSGAISLGSVGSRRTVYLSEDEPPSSPPAKSDNVIVTRQSPPPPPPPLLVYNKISTVYGEPQRSTAVLEHQSSNAVNTTTDKDATAAKKKSDGIKETTATWYEYGCV